ncbi:hypothetical protein C8F04DRAFT_714328, partial [Mycena alexandri]
MDYLAAIEHAQTIGQELLTAQRSDLTQLMSMMQKFLGSLSADRENNLRNGLSTNLYTLRHENLELLPDFHLRSGEVVRIGQYPVSGTSSVDIYEGLYLGREKVAIEVVRAMDSNETTLRRFRRECLLWKDIWNVDKGMHIRPFYGYCLEDGPLPY